MLYILLIYDFFPYLHGLLVTTRSFILLKNFYLHIYLELEIFHFRVKTVNFNIFFYLKTTTIWPIDMAIDLLIV